jgi:hypothetical protein
MASNKWVCDRVLQLLLDVPQMGSKELQHELKKEVLNGRSI